MSIFVLLQLLQRTCSQGLSLVHHGMWLGVPFAGTGLPLMNSISGLLLHQPTNWDRKLVGLRAADTFIFLFYYTTHFPNCWMNC
jgi:hypothetical protein